MSKIEKINTAAKRVDELAQIEKTIAEIQKRKKINALKMPSIDALINSDHTVDIPFFVRRLITDNVLDSLDALRKQLLEEIEEITI